MICSETSREKLLQEGRRLLAAGYERASIVDEARAEELAELYREIGHEVVVLEGAIVGQGHECHACLDASGLFTLFVRKHPS
jgi:hypothetical protein